MFFHNFKYSFKVLLKNKVLIFWTIAWPLILGTMFYLAFSNISESEKMDTISLGIVDNKQYEEDKYLVNTLNELGNKESDSYLFDITYGNVSDMNEKLDKKEIAGYILKEDMTKVVVKENGIDQTVIKYVIDEVYEYQYLTTNLIENEINNEIMNGNNPDIDKIYHSVINKIQDDKSYIIDKSKNNIDYVVIEFYTLIAMTALFGAMLTTTVVSNYLANINKKGARVTLAPISRLKLLFGGILASLIIQIIAIVILLIYTKVGLKIDYGNRMDLVILLSFIAVLAGNALGLVGGAITFKNEASRTGFVMTITMLGSFLSGMMGITMKYVIDTNIPILNLINPANMITDGFYSLYYYDTLDRFYFNVISLLIFTGILIMISYFLMRRKKYDSI